MSDSLHGYHPVVIDQWSLTAAEWSQALRWGDRESTWHFLQGLEYQRHQTLTPAERRCIERKPSNAEAARIDGAGKLGEMTVLQRKWWGDRVHYARMKYNHGRRLWYGDGRPQARADSELLAPLRMEEMRLR